MAMSDSDHMGCPVTRRSTSGLVLFLGGCCLKSSSTLQSLLCLSVGESEYYALVKACAAGLGFRTIMSEFGLPVTLEVQTDSTSADSLGSRLGVARTKHMQSRWLWVQERVKFGELTIRHVGTNENTSDVLTKPVGRPELDKACEAASVLFN